MIHSALPRSRRALQKQNSKLVQFYQYLTLRFIVPVGIASAIPRLELFMELIGAVLLSVMGLMLPAISETVFRWGKDLGPFYCIVFKNIIVVLFSLIAMVSGVVYSIKTMLEKL